MAARDLLEQRLYRNLIRGQHARMPVRGRPASFRDDAGGSNQRHLLSILLKHNRLFRRIQVFSGAGMQNPGTIQYLTSIKKCIYPIIQCMVIGQCHGIDSHFLKQGNLFRCQTEGILLVCCLRSAAAERKLLIDCKIIDGLDCIPVILVQDTGNSACPAVGIQHMVRQKHVTRKENRHGSARIF